MSEAGALGGSAPAQTAPAASVVLGGEGATAPASGTSVRVPRALRSLQRILDLGVPPDLEQQLALRVRVSNGLAGLNVVVCLGIALRYIWLGSLPLTLSVLASASTWMLVFAANRWHHYRTSRTAVVLLFLANLMIYIGLLGESARMESMCFAVCVLGCFLFTLAETLFWLLSLVLSMGVYYFGHTLTSGWGVPMQADSSTPIMSSATTFIELVLVAFVFALESQRSMRALRA